MEAWEVLKCMQPAPGVYDKEAFIDYLKGMNSQDFNRFCRSYLHLLEFYNRNKNAWITDDMQLVIFAGLKKR